MNISDYIPFGKDNAISRKKLEKVTGLSDRDIREEIAMARRNTVILNLSNGQGYFQPIEGEEDELVIKYYKQESSRLKRIGWSLLATRKRVRETQKTTIQQGVASRADVIVPNPVSLIPYRTFLEITQPESSFVFRIDGSDNMPEFTLIEADGGLWVNQAKAEIKKYLEKNLKELGTNIVIMA